VNEAIKPLQPEGLMGRTRHPPPPVLKLATFRDLMRKKSIHLKNRGIMSRKCREELLPVVAKKCRHPLRLPAQTPAISCKGT